ncbi:urease accessory protein UreE [Derxia gummosa]|uniref:Urease accessory protein UreE n=1 Tax=Derxia gummosa DSM 723 TaxID=1121388 RepID=A0A8B6XA16_9BURK|nr:urease accessory protein UreE [Derxia gummosa]
MLQVRTVSSSPAPADGLRRLRLPFDARQRSRLAATLADGTAVALALPRGTVLHDGDQLVASTGEHLLVEAEAEPVMRVTALSPYLLMRALYHLANRHVAVQIAEDHLLIERDPVLARMLAGLGAEVVADEAPFDPETGAYAHSHGADAHGHHHHADEFDPVSASVGEQLSIEAHARRARGEA